MDLAEQVNWTLYTYPAGHPPCELKLSPLRQQSSFCFLFPFNKQVLEALNYHYFLLFHGVESQNFQKYNKAMEGHD